MAFPLAGVGALPVPRCLPFPLLAATRDEARCDGRAGLELLCLLDDESSAYGESWCLGDKILI